MTDVVEVARETIVTRTAPGEVSVVSRAAQGPVGPSGPTGPAGPSGADSLEVTVAIVDALTEFNLAAGSSADLDGTPIALGSTGELRRVSVGSSVACKWEVKKLVGLAETMVDVFYTGGLADGPAEPWVTPLTGFVTLLGNGVDVRYRVTVTNLDGLWAADVHATIYVNEVPAP